jgi:hypothetical protein
MQYPIFGNPKIVWAPCHIFWNLKRYCIPLTKPRRNTIPSLGYNITPWQLSEANFDTSRVIVGKDFNHLKEIDRRRKAGECFMMRREAASWHHMTFQYELANAWKLNSFWKMCKKDYTFDNGRSRTRSVVSRIDKFIVSQDLDMRGGESK